MGFITGSCLRSDYVASASLHEQWDICNAMVLNWIMSSLSQDVYLGHVFSDNAGKVWEELRDTYDKVDGSIVFNLLQKINTFKQGGLPVSEYYHKLNSLWREFDILTKLPDCTCAARAELVDHGKLLRLMQFLMGLDDIYQYVRSNILTREILPEAKDTFVIIFREESHRGIPASFVKTKKPQASAFVSRSNDNNRNRPNNTNGNWSNSNSNNGNKENYDSLLCKNYGLKGHTIERCFEIIGYPSGFKRNPNLKPSGVMKLISLLNDKSGSTANAHMAGSSSCSFFNCSVFFNQYFYKFYCANVKIRDVNYYFGWIIDFGANQYMTNSCEKMFDLANVSELNLTVGHPNGTLAKITHVGNLKLNNNVVLFVVLVIPEYTVSLLSVNKLIKDSKVNVCFDETKCYIQDLKKEKVLGTGRESAGLYLFDTNCAKSAMCLDSNSLGHPANQVLKLLKGSLNLSNIDHNGPCEVCHKA
ncbi:ribonuclease H-like domain-containing protein, partial [Tanacetum coccineum]